MNKKSLLAFLLVVSMTGSLTGCGLADKVAAEIVANKNTTTEETIEETSEEEETTSKAEEKEEPKKKERLTGTPVFGDTNINYDGYAYLESVDIENEDGDAYTVFIPMTDYNYVNDTSAEAEAMGVNVKVDVEPYLQYDSQDYSVNENLEYLVNNYYDPFYYPEYKDLKTDFSAKGDNWAKCDISYICQAYDEFDVYYDTLYLIETKKDTYVTVEIKVSKSAVTGKTDDLIREIESFYQFDINWDEDEAQSRADKFEADPSSYPNMFSVSDFLFELPADWDRDSDYGEYDEYYYAPFGKVSLANSFVEITSEYSSECQSTIEAFAANPKQAEEIFKTMYGDDVETMTAKKADDTCFGTTILIEMTVKNDDGDEVQLREYLAASNSCLYIVAAGSYDGDTTGFDLAESILKNGKVKND